MICERCRKEATNGAHMCPHCGAPLRPSRGQSGSAAMRQGRTYEPTPVYQPPVDPENVLQDTLSGSRYHASENPSRQQRERRAQPARSQSRRHVSRHARAAVTAKQGKNAMNRSVNTAMLIAVLLCILMIAAVALFIVAIRTTPGHMFLMNAVQGDEEKEAKVVVMIGEEAAAKTLWKIGTDLIDQGYIDRSIETYQRAYEMYPDIDGLYEYLLMLAEAYEAGGRMSDAEGVYHQLYTQVDKKNPMAYRYAISIMMDQERLFEATDLMKLAFENTGEMSFKSQRDQLVPQAPTASLSAGQYKIDQVTELLSPQGYDIYYLINDTESELPEGGRLYTDPIKMPEGTYNIRAVCVSTALISDEVTIKYTISLPSPGAPKARLAPGEYDRQQRVYLYAVDENGKQSTLEKEKLTVYYTIDGTVPNSDSPIYTNEGILLPGGRVKLRAVSVNEHGKVSNELLMEYRINVKFKNFFRDTEDQFKNFTVGKTTYEQFRKTYGAGEAEEIADSNVISGKAIKVTYDWGEARFVKDGEGLYYVRTNASSMTGPRNSKVGMELDDLTALFRDMGQVANAKGNRSLYWDEYTGAGKYWKETDELARVEYTYLREDGGETLLTYRIKNGKVVEISMMISGGEV
ncbi:MAG: chitobiase/beta-hexosaminidase C-terminal domain-containing protein [Clostridia bacterium]|nr:chitobiase/beta-hexosaminidase C-terminal domain-containing protein [Clostridia bacterium]